MTTDGIHRALLHPGEADPHTRIAIAKAIAPRAIAAGAEATVPVAAAVLAAAARRISDMRAER